LTDTPFLLFLLLLLPFLLRDLRIHHINPHLTGLETLYRRSNIFTKLLRF
jgi:hypothetical protein